jgi:hypothetical protein
MNIVSVVSLFESHIATCFLDGPDGFLGFEGEPLLLLAPLASVALALELPLLFDLFPDFFCFLLAFDIQLASESVSDSLLIPKEGLWNPTKQTI